MAKAAAECDRLTTGFGANLPSPHRHAFNNAVMPLGYALDTCTRRLAAILRRQAPPANADHADTVRALLDGTRASVERIGGLVHRLGTVGGGSTSRV